MQNLTKEWKQPPVTGEFLQYIYSMVADKTHQKMRSRCLAHEFSFTDIFNDINHGYNCGCFQFMWMWLFIVIMKRSAERKIRAP